MHSYTIEEMQAKFSAGDNPIPLADSRIIPNYIAYQRILTYARLAAWISGKEFNPDTTSWRWEDLGTLIDKMKNALKSIPETLEPEVSLAPSEEMPPKADTPEVSVRRIFYDENVKNSGKLLLSEPITGFDEILVITYWDTGAYSIWSSAVMPARTFAEYRDKKWMQVYNYDRVVICMRKESPSGNSLEYSAGGFMIDSGSNAVPLSGAFGIKAIYGLSYT